MTFDLLQLDTKAAAESGFRLVLENPFTLEPLHDEQGPFYIDIIGGDAGDVVDVTQAIDDARLDRIQRTRSIVTESEIKRQEDAEILAAATKGWRLPPLGGADIPFSKERAKEIYLDPRFPWIKEQVDKAVGDRKRFFKKNSPA